MEKIISYNELPFSFGDSVYYRRETDPKLYLALLAKGYKVISDIRDSDSNTIYITGRRQDNNCKNNSEYKELINSSIQETFKREGITKPKTSKFSFYDLISYKYSLPFVLKNDNQNGGKEKFLIKTEDDYNNLIEACLFLIDRKKLLLSDQIDDLKYQIDYNKYLDVNFSIQEYINTPTEFNTTVRILTSPENDLLYAALKYNKPVPYIDNTTLLGYLLREKFPLSTKSIVSNTLSGGSNILIGESNYSLFEESLLEQHNINSKQFEELVNTSCKIHHEFNKELGVICGFDYIYDKNSNKWYLLEYHSRPMVGDYSKRQGIPYSTNNDRLTADGRVRATALSLVLRKKN